MKILLAQVLFLFLFLVIAFTQLEAQIYPNGGEILIATKEYSILWNPSDFSNEEVQISLWMYKESSWRVIGIANGNQGKYLWQIPYIHGDQYRIKVQSTRNPSKIKLSTTFFSIRIESIGGGSGQPTDSEVQDDIQCIPSPATISVNCIWNEENAIAISVYSLTGTRMHQQTLVPSVMSQSIHCKSWISGTYVVDVIFNDGKHRLGKFIKIG